MTTRAWIGGGNNKASNPDNWSPTGTPQPGDSLSMSAGTMNIADDALRGDTLSVGFPGVTLNLSHHANATVVSGNSFAPVTINIDGMDSLSVSASGAIPFFGEPPVTVHIAEHATFQVDHWPNKGRIFSVELARVKWNDEWI